MSPALLLLLRLIHVGAGALWVGMAIYMTMFLGPAVQEVGPDGGKVMAALQRRGIMTVLPALALATVLSGLWLYWHASAGFAPGFSTSGAGLGFGVGGAASLVAYGLGMTVMRPSMMKAMALAQQIGPDTPEADRRQQMAEAQRLRVRANAAGRWVAGLLLLALAAMAVARYL